MSNMHTCPKCKWRWHSRVPQPKRCPRCGKYMEYIPCGRKRVWVPDSKRYYAGRPRGTGRNALESEDTEVDDKTKIVKYRKMEVENNE